MGVILLPQHLPHIQQPIDGELVLQDRWRSRVAIAQVAGASPGGLQLDVSTGALVSVRGYTANGTSMGVGPHGRGITTSSSTANGAVLSGSVPRTVTSDGAYTGSMTMIVLANPAASGSSRSMPICWTKGSAPESYILFNCNENDAVASGKFAWRIDDGSPRGVASTAATYVDGLPHVFAWRRRNAVDITCWHDGISVSVSSNGNSLDGRAIGSGSSVERLGGYSSGSFGLNGAAMPICLTFNDWLTDVEMSLMRPDNIWRALFEPRVINYPVPFSTPTSFRAAWARRTSRVIGAGVH